jgi:hypothetical protein
VTHEDYAATALRVRDVFGECNIELTRGLLAEVTVVDRATGEAVDDVMAVESMLAVASFRVGKAFEKQTLAVQDGILEVPRIASQVESLKLLMAGFDPCVVTLPREREPEQVWRCVAALSRTRECVIVIRDAKSRLPVSGCDVSFGAAIPSELEAARPKECFSSGTGGALTRIVDGEEQFVLTSSFICECHDVVVSVRHPRFLPVEAALKASGEPLPAHFEIALARQD